MKKFGLASQIFVALVLGIVLGALFHGNETVMAIIAPIGDIKKLGKLGRRPFYILRLSRSLPLPLRLDYCRQTCSIRTLV
jgi:Na+/H+-dicarboxylate symporter